MIKGYFIDKNGQVYYYNNEEHKFEKADVQKNVNTPELETDVQERE